MIKDDIKKIEHLVFYKKKIDPEVYPAWIRIECILREYEERYKNKNTCKICNKKTNTIFNISLKMVFICDNCVDNLYEYKKKKLVK